MALIHRSVCMYTYTQKMHLRTDLDVDAHTHGAHALDLNESRLVGIVATSAIIRLSYVCMCAYVYVCICVCE